MFAIVTGVLSLYGCGLKGTPPQTYRVDLEVWGVFDDSDAYQQVFAEYRKINPYVGNINYHKFAPETYKADLLDALAAGKGPDIFMIRNAWRESFEDKSTPAPETLVNEQQFRDIFVDVAATDLIGANHKIFGMPLSVDSLALYYNKDIFNAAGIARPPVTWEELLDDTRKLNRIDTLGKINQSAIAAGTAYNINRSTDILSVLMLQLGSNIAESGQRRLSFNDANSVKALDFYTQFAKLGSGYYSWNPRQHYSIDAFYEGTLGMMINYSWQYPILVQKNAKLNFGIAPLPQFSGTTPVNYANYWAFAVSKNKVVELPEGSRDPNSTLTTDQKNTVRTHEAWQLLKFLAFPHQENVVTLQNGLAGTAKDFKISIDPADQYLTKTLKPAARRDLIEKQKSNVVLSSFATGNLIARNWFQGNMEGVESVFGDMIDAVNRGEKTTIEALTTASNRIEILSR